MRIAILLCGQPRFLEKGFEVLSRKLIKPNEKNEIDFFIHCWHDPVLVGHAYPGASWNTNQTGVYKTETPSKIIELYKPKKILIEQSLTEKELEIREHNYQDHPGRGGSTLHSLFSQYYSMKKANELKVEYENLPGNKKYDLVLRTRFDLGLKNEINLVEKTTENVEEGTVWTHDQLVNFYVRATPELFFFGSSETVDTLCGTTNREKPGLFGSMNDFFEKDKVHMSGERYFGHLIDKNKIKEKALRFDYELIRE